MPPITPVAKALPHSMLPQPAVMDTKPQRQGRDPCRESAGAPCAGAPENLRKLETWCSFMRFQVPQLLKLQGADLLLSLGTNACYLTSQSAIHIFNNCNDSTTNFQRLAPARIPLQRPPTSYFLVIAKPG